MRINVPFGFSARFVRRAVSFSDFLSHRPSLWPLFDFFFPDFHLFFFSSGRTPRVPARQHIRAGCSPPAPAARRSFRIVVPSPPAAARSPRTAWREATVLCTC